MIIYLAYAILLATTLVVASSATSLASSLLSRKRSCPRCRHSLSLTRKPRNKFDRLVGRFVDSRRYKCLACQWTGLLRHEAGEVRSDSGTTLEIDKSLATAL